MSALPTMLPMCQRGESGSTFVFHMRLALDRILNPGVWPGSFHSRSNAAFTTGSTHATFPAPIGSLTLPSLSISASSLSGRIVRASLPSNASGSAP